MGEKLNAREVVTFDELLRSCVYEQGALRRILVRRGILTDEEEVAEIKTVRREVVFGGFHKKV